MIPILRGQRILIAGCGDLGLAVGKLLSVQGAETFGLRRRALPPAQPVQSLRADLCDFSQLQKVLADKTFHYVIACASAGEFSDAAYQAVYVRGLANLCTALQYTAPPRRIFLVSSTRVYPQDAGQWVEEDSPTAPHDFAARRLLEAEQLLRVGKLPYTILRCAGIYGPGRNTLLQRVRSGIGYRRTPPLYANRIHRDDCAGALLHLLQKDHCAKKIATCYLGVDCAPVPLAEVMEWLATQLNVAAGETMPNSGSRGIRRSRRLSNRRLLESGYVFRYPDYRSGYAELVADANL